jgi:hypothetical protein
MLVLNLQNGYVKNGMIRILCYYYYNEVSQLRPIWDPGRSGLIIEMVIW